jgi:hypothetical protein
MILNIFKGMHFFFFSGAATHVMMFEKHTDRRDGLLWMLTILNNVLEKDL